MNYASLTRLQHLRKSCEWLKGRQKCDSSVSILVLVLQCLIIMSVWMLPAKHSKSYHVISKSDIYGSLYNLFHLMYAISLGFKYHRPGWYYYLTSWTFSIFFASYVPLGRPQLTEVFLSLIFFRFQWYPFFNSSLIQSHL